MHAVVTLPDAKRGEQIVLVTDHKEACVPRAIACVAAIPVLGTGKIDYVNVGQLASQLAAAS